MKKISVKEIIIIIAELLALVCFGLSIMFDGNKPLMFAGLNLFLICMCCYHVRKKDDNK